MDTGLEKVIKYGLFDQKAGELDRQNNTLKEDLNDIKILINNTNTTWESNAAEEIRMKINGMEPRFEQYYQVVENYAKLIRNIAQQYETGENVNKGLAEQFI
ncbi:MAG: WXG100 family type VII secretion target [Butyrivibrio sp.]|nr:WXG100 family type VII secretion target [Butyrivibrio sp.]